MSPADIAVRLRPWHARTLSHMQSMCLFGWENFGPNEFELETLGLILGQWMGSLDSPAQPMWIVTELGRKVFELLRVQYATDKYTRELVEPRSITKA